MQFLLTIILSSVLFFTGCSKKSSAPSNTVLPVLSIANITQPRPLSNTNFRFYITLNNSSTTPVSVHYTTVAGTALPNTDFIPVSGDVSIPAGSQQNFIDVQVIGDSLRQVDKQFSVQLSAAQNCTLANATGTATIDNSNGTYLPTVNSGYTTPSTYPGMSLVWSDEFSGSTLDQANWNYEIGGNGWGNQELENYTSRLQNSFVSNGNLIIEARQENMGSNNYTSARLTTKGKREFKFGRIDIRAKLPVGKGIWPALWMLGANISTVPWPACGETDIMELIGVTPSKVYGTLHFANATGQHAQAGGNYSIAGEDFSNKFHVFSCIWVQDSLKILVDNNLMFTGTKNSIGSTYPFNSPSFFIFNVAVGGQWPGPPDPGTPFPERMFVDYVRVFQ